MISQHSSDPQFGLRSPGPGLQPEYAWSWTWLSSVESTLELSDLFHLLYLLLFHAVSFAYWFSRSAQTARLVGLRYLFVDAPGASRGFLHLEETSAHLHAGSTSFLMRWAHFVHPWRLSLPSPLALQPVHGISFVSSVYGHETKGRSAGSFPRTDPWVSSSLLVPPCHTAATVSSPPGRCSVAAPQYQRGDVSISSWREVTRSFRYCYRYFSGSASPPS